MIDEFFNQSLLIYPFYSKYGTLEKDVTSALKTNSVLRQVQITTTENTLLKYTSLLFQPLNEPLPKFSTAAVGITPDQIKLENLFNYSYEAKNSKEFKEFIEKNSIASLKKDKAYSTKEKNRLILLNEAISGEDISFILIPKDSHVSGGVYHYAHNLVREKTNKGIFYDKLMVHFPRIHFYIFPVNNNLATHMKNLELFIEQFIEQDRRNKKAYENSTKLTFNE